MLQLCPPSPAKEGQCPSCKVLCLVSLQNVEAHSVRYTADTNLSTVLSIVIYSTGGKAGNFHSNCDRNVTQSFLDQVNRFDLIFWCQSCITGGIMSFHKFYENLPQVDLLYKLPDCPLYRPLISFTMSSVKSSALEGFCRTYKKPSH